LPEACLKDPVGTTALFLASVRRFFAVLVDQRAADDSEQRE
jgi:hypothetical protein